MCRLCVMMFFLLVSWSVCCTSSASESLRKEISVDIANRDFDNALTLLKNADVVNDGELLKLHTELIKRLSEAEEYDKIIDTVNIVFDSVENTYLSKYKNRLIDIETNSDPLVIYYSGMLKIRGYSYYELQQYASALSDLKKYIEFDDDLDVIKKLIILGYKTGNIDDSISFSKILFYLDEDLNVKYVTAYNIAVFYAIQDNIDSFKEWISIPLSNNKDLWLKKIIDDNDLSEFRKKYNLDEFYERF